MASLCAKGTQSGQREEGVEMLHFLDGEAMPNSLPTVHVKYMFDA